MSNRLGFAQALGALGQCELRQDDLAAARAALAEAASIAAELVVTPESALAGDIEALRRALAKGDDPSPP